MTSLARIVAPVLVLAAGLQVGSAALAQNAVRGVPPPPHRTARYISVKVWQGANEAPNVSVRVPTALVSATIGVAAWSGILDHGLEQARAHASHDCGASIRITGRQIVSLWNNIVSGGPADLVRVDDGGDRVVVRLE